MKVALDPAKLAILNKKFVTQEKQSSQDFEKTKFYSLAKYGEYIFRILPLTADQGNFLGKYIGHHYIKFEGEEKGNFVPCVESYNVQDAMCPICEAMRELSLSGIDTKGFWKYRSNTEVALKVLMISAPNETDLPMDKLSIFKVSIPIIKEIVNIYSDPLQPDMLDPRAGCAFLLKRKEGDKKWSVGHLDSSMPQCGLLGGSEENCKALLEANENCKLDSIFKLPSDEKMLEVKEVAKKVKERIIRAKAVVDSSVSDIAGTSASVQQAPAAVVVEKEIPIVNPLQQAVPTQTAPATPNYQVLNDPVVDSLDATFDYTAPAPAPTPAVAPVVEAAPVQQPAQANEKVVDYNNLTPEQKAIIERYRDGCPKACFGRADVYDGLRNKECLLDPYSSSCALCIKELTGKDVEMF